MCEFSGKNINAMRKHMNMKHGDNKCKICGKAFTNSMDVLAHTAKCHDQEEKKSNETTIVKAKEDKSPH